MLIHQKNINEKIRKNYNGLQTELTNFRDTIYASYKRNMENIDFRNRNINDFVTAAQLITNYYAQAKSFADTNGISSQSKFVSSILEELNHFLFSTLAQNNGYSEYNSKVFAGLVFDENDNIVLNKKNVDYCIGKEIRVNISRNNRNYRLNIKKPIVAIEVKTYLDATMFSGVRSFSSDLKRGSVDCKTYVLMAYKNIDNAHILYARGATDLDEIFVLCDDERCAFDSQALFEYYQEIADAIVNYNNPNPPASVGRLLNR